MTWSCGSAVEAADGAGEQATAVRHEGGSTTAGLYEENEVYAVDLVVSTGEGMLLLQMTGWMVAFTCHKLRRSIEALDVRGTPIATFLCPFRSFLWTCATQAAGRDANNGVRRTHYFICDERIWQLSTPASIPPPVTPAAQAAG